MLAPLVLATWTVLRYGVDVPYWDEWAMVEMVQRSIEGTLRPAELFAQHNEHRILFPRLVMLALGRMFHLSMRPGMIAILVCLAITGALLLRDHLRTFGTTPGSLAAFVPISALLFSLRQWENLLWNWQIQMVMCVLAVVVSVRALHGGRSVTAIAAAIVASYSFSSGLLVWPVGVLQLLVSSPRRVRAGLIAWVACGAIVIASYLHGYVKPANHPSLAFSFAHPGTAIRYLLASVGMPVAISASTATIAGCVVVALCGCIAWGLRSGRMKPGPAIGFVAFALCTSVMLTLGRAGFGVDQALSSRYATFGALAFIGVYALLLQAADDGAFRALAVVFATAAVVMVCDIDRDTLGSVAAVRGAREEAVGVLRALPAASDADVRRLLYPDASFVRAEAAFLRRSHLSVFR